MMVVAGNAEQFEGKFNLSGQPPGIYTHMELVLVTAKVRLQMSLYRFAYKAKYKFH